MPGSATMSVIEPKALASPTPRDRANACRFLGRIVVLPHDPQDVGVPDTHEGPDMELPHEPSTYESDT